MDINLLFNKVFNKDFKILSKKEQSNVLDFVKKNNPIILSTDFDDSEHFFLKLEKNKLFLFFDNSSYKICYKCEQGQMFGLSLYEYKNKEIDHHYFIYSNPRYYKHTLQQLRYAFDSEFSCLEILEQKESLKSKVSKL